MSGVGASTAVKSGPSALDNADGLLALAAFVQKPEYASRVKELQAAEAAAKEAQKVASDTLARVASDDTALQAEKIDFKRQLADFLASKEQANSKLIARETSVSAREATVQNREKDYLSNVAIDDLKFDKQESALSERQAVLDQREKELSKLKATLDGQAADLARRLDKLREATR